MIEENNMQKTGEVKDTMRLKIHSSRTMGTWTGCAASVQGKECFSHTKGSVLALLRRN